MPMGIVSDSDFDIEQSKLKTPDVVPNQQDRVKKIIAEVDDIKRGRTNGRLQVPNEIREMAAKSAINGEGSADEIAKAYGISESSLSAYKVGAHSTTTYHEPNPELAPKITDHKERISKKARARLLAALNELSPDKLAGVKARDLAAIAKDMSTIVSDMEPPPSAPTNQNNVQFVFMAPRIQSLDEYQTLNVKE